MKIENILIEHFPRLKCANFSILFNKSFEDVSSVRIHLRPTEIFVNFGNNRCTTIELSTLSVQIQINSLSLLLANGNLISFRINIASGFDEELLATNVTNQAPHQLKRVSMSVQPNEEFHIICDNCSGPLSDKLQYRRILELPSENMDSHEWFCHQPNQRHCNHSAKNPMTTRDRVDKNDDNTSDHHRNMNTLTPNESDLLFGNFFALFNCDNFTNIQINSQRKMVHCRRCLNHIGEYLSNDSIKIWNGNIKINGPADQSPKRIFNDSDSLFANFLVIVDRISYDFELLGYQTLKLLFEAHNLKGTRTYLFIQTMSRNLELYQMSNDPFDENEEQVSMSRVDGIKCLFLCEEDTEPQLLEFWQKDVNVVSAEISIEMVNGAVEKLQHFAQYVPEPFRMNNGFCLSYLSNNIK